MASMSADYCEECDERQICSSEPECPVCGSALQVRHQDGNSSQIPNNETIDTTLMIHEILMGMNNSAQGGLSDQSNQHGASEMAVNQLQRFIVGDVRCSVLHEIALELLSGNLDESKPTSTAPQSKRSFFESQIASFSKLPPTSPESLGIIFGCPEEGDVEFENKSEMKGKVVVLKRGKVSFAKKSLNAQAAGAAAVVIIQTVPVWPYTMLDSAGEAKGGEGQDELTIPVVMVKPEDGNQIRSMLSENSQQSSCKDDFESPHCMLHVHQVDKECSICQDEYRINTVAIRLPCRHHFHEKCILLWFQKHNTCPICRFQLQDKAGSEVDNGDKARDNTYLSWFS